MTQEKTEISDANKGLVVFVTCALIALGSTLAWMFGSGVYGIVQFMYKIEGPIGAFKVLAGLQVTIIILTLVGIYADYDINGFKMRASAQYRIEQKKKWRFWFIWVCTPVACYLFPAMILIGFVTRTGLKIVTFFVKLFQLILGRRETM